MNQAEVSKLMSQLRFAVQPRHKKLRNPGGPEGRLKKLRKTVNALIKHERIELNYPRAEEARGYAERVSAVLLKYQIFIQISQDLTPLFPSSSFLKRSAMAIATLRPWTLPTSGWRRSNSSTSCSRCWCHGLKTAKYRSRECTRRPEIIQGSRIKGQFSSLEAIPIPRCCPTSVRTGT